MGSSHPRIEILHHPITHKMTQVPFGIEKECVSLELLQLRYFTTVARLENISHAAAYHMIPQSAMSKTISKLERELGVPLFHRVKNKISLTDEGRIFYQGIQASLFALDSALNEIHEIHEGGRLQGEVKCLVQQQRYNLVDCIAAFKHIHPDVHFSIYHTLKDAVEYDFCISSFAPTEHEDLCVPILEEELKVVVSKDHPLAGQKSVTLPELRHENFLFLSPDSTVLRIFNTFCERYGFQPKVTTYVNDLKCMEKYVAYGVGIAIAPTVSWKYLSFPGSIFLSVDEPSFTRKTFLFRNSLRPLNRAAGTFVEYLEHNLINFIGLPGEE